MNQVIFFDGVCNLCNGFVDFVISRDREGVFRFASLQGETAKSRLPAHLRDDLETVVLWSQGQTYLKSDAVLTVLGQLGGIWNLARIGWVVPRCVRDWAYRVVASNRYALFGKKDTCRLPTPEERARFLD